MTGLNELYQRADKPIPSELKCWEEQVAQWYTEYQTYTFDAHLLEMNLELAVFVFDATRERVVLAYAISTEQLNKRDVSRIIGFPNVNASTQKDGQDKGAFFSDKGHFLGHASGGELDINLFPHRRELNRGWSAEGKRFRAMGRFVAENSGSFFYHRPVYDDDTWVPSSLEYGVLKNDTFWWKDHFINKNSGMHICDEFKIHV